MCPSHGLESTGKRAGIDPAMFGSGKTLFDAGRSEGALRRGGAFTSAGASGRVSST
jgi:hypothetical protein